MDGRCEFWIARLCTECFVKDVHGWDNSWQGGHDTREVEHGFFENLGS